jgi:hypothetical protein
MIHISDPAFLIRLAFLVVVLIAGAFLAFYLIRQIHLPRNLEFQELDSSELSEGARDRLDAVDDHVKELGFEPVVTFTIPGLAAVNENRLYWNREHKTRLVASFTTFRGRPTLFLECASAFEDQDQLSTSNIPPVSYLAVPPWSEIDRHPEVHDPQELFRIHRENIGKASRAGKVSRDSLPAGLGKDIIEEQIRLMDYQVEQGRFKLNQERDRYEGTWRIAFASLSFFIDPRAGVISGRRACLAIASAFLCCAAAVIITRVLEIHSLLVENFPTVIPPKLGFLAYCPSFILSGIIAGWLIPKRGFVWGFMASLCGILLLPGAVPLKILLPLISGQSALLTNRLREALSGQRPRMAGAIIVLFGLILLGYLLAS